MNTKFIAFSTAAAVGMAAFACAALARDQVKVAGSSTVLPYANIVAEQFGKAFGDFKTPVIEVRRLVGRPQAVLRRRWRGQASTSPTPRARSSRAEQEECAKNGVNDIVEVKFGYDGIVFAVDASAGDWKLEPKDLYLALAAEVPKDGALVANPYKTWKEVNPRLPDTPIAAFIPGEKHGTREVFEEKVLHAGCKAIGGDKLHLAKAEGKDDEAKKKAADKACNKVRKDGAAVDIDGDYTETLARIQSNKQGVGVFGLSFYENNKDKLKVATISGVEPSLETVASRQVPGFAPAVLLREEGSPRRDPRPQGIR